MTDNERLNEIIKKTNSCLAGLEKMGLKPVIDKSVKGNCFELMNHNEIQSVIGLDELECKSKNVTEQVKLLINNIASCISELVPVNEFCKIKFQTQKVEDQSSSISSGN